jgi:hypothetical protein
VLPERELAMRTAARLLGTPALLAALWLVAPPSSEAKDANPDKANLLTRSIYLPVDIALCEHLRDAVLYQDDQAVSLLPAKRIFQFTYYPGLSRIEPMRTDLRVEGHRADGSDFIGKLAVTPWGVFTASRKIELDMNKQLEKLRFKLDVRYQPVHLKMRCADSCERQETVASTGVGSPLEQ